MKAHPNDKKMFAVYTNTDTTEGRGQEYAFAFCELEATAKRVATRAYVMGTDAPYREVNVLFIDGHYYFPNAYVAVPTAGDIQEEAKLQEIKRKAEAKAAAIAKAKNLGLTDEEIAALR